jgi:hypothetical protein
MSRLFEQRDRTQYGADRAGRDVDSWPGIDGRA